MAIFLLILKIIGYILLGLLGLLVFLLLLILFAPFRYYVDAWNEQSVTEDVTKVLKTGNGGNVYVTWLLHFIKVIMPFDEGPDGTKAYIFWGKLLVHPRPVKSNTKPVGQELVKQETLITSPENEAENQAEGSVENITDKVIDKADEEAAEDAPTEVTSDEETPWHKNILKKKIPKRSSEKKQKDDGAKKEPFLEKFNRFKEDYLSEQSRESIKKLLKEVVYILKKICPRKAKGYVNYGFSSPDITGELLAVIAATPLVYKTELRITPDFETEENYARFNVKISGRIQLYILVKVIIDILIDKELRKFVSKFM